MDETFLPLGVVPIPSDPDAVNVAAFQDRSLVAGPGPRAVIWVAGCLRRCPECSLPQYLSFASGEPVAVNDLASRILAIPGIEGVTYSGGEPFEQAPALASLCRILRRFGLNTASYSGYTLEALQAEPDRFEVLLRELDLLIDGEFRRDRAGSYLWRGSSNQRLHWLSSAVEPTDTGQTARRMTQITVRDGRLLMTGFPKAGFEEALMEQFDKRGIQLKKAKP